MSPSLQRRTFLRIGGSVIVTLTAGCTSGENSKPSQSPTPKPSPEPTATPSPTPEPVGTGNNPADLVIVNQTEDVQSISLQVDKQGGSTVFTEMTELDPGDRIRRDIFGNDATGTYLITAQLSDGTENSYEWELSKEPAGGWVYITIEADNTIDMAYAIA